MPNNKCECGCGQKVRKGRRFVHGHNTKGLKFSEERRRNISNSLKGKPSPLKGRPRSDETKRLLSEAMKGERNHMFGKHLSEDHKRKVSEGIRGEKNGNYGRDFSPVHRAKISAASRLRKHSESTKRKLSELNKGDKNRFYGKKHSEATKEKIRLFRATQKLPVKDTDIERIMEKGLLNAGIHFEKHKRFRVRDTFHETDLFIEPNIIIECDGDYIHSLPWKVERDVIIDYELGKQGYIILRFWGSEIKNSLEMCLNKIKEKISITNLI